MTEIHDTSAPLTRARAVTSPSTIVIALALLALIAILGIGLLAGR